MAQHLDSQHRRKEQDKEEEEEENEEKEEEDYDHNDNWSQQSVDLLNIPSFTEQPLTEYLL